MKNIVQKSVERMAGDGKTPNHYWVSISNDYYYLSEQDGNSMDWISNLKLFTVQGKTLERFDTYQAAKEFAETELYIGDKSHGMTVNCITIEDRLSGEIYSHIKHYYPETGKIDNDWISEDTQFTQDELAKKHIQFK